MNSKTKKEVTVPGEHVGIQEEYESGFGTYNEEGEIYSSSTGKLVLDREKHTAEVRASTRIPKIQKTGTITLGEVVRSKGQTVMVDLEPFESRKFTFVPSDKSAIIHVSNIKDEYIDDVNTQYKVGDIVRVKIKDESKHTVELTTDQGNLGVVKAYCAKCRNVVDKIGRDKVKCPKCGKVDTRKTANDYREGNIK